MDKNLDNTFSGQLSQEEYEITENDRRDEKLEIKQIIDSTIIDALRENNIFQDIMSIEQIRNKLIDIVDNIIYEDMKERGMVGYWRANDGTLALENNLKEKIDFVETREIIIHELLHALSTKSVFEMYQKVDWCGIKKNWAHKEVGRGLNEGITEYLAQKLCPESEYVHDNGRIRFNCSGTYLREQIAIKQLAILYGEDKIIDAYLNNHDIDMPQQQYLELRANFDYINEKNSRIQNIYKGRTWEELSESEQSEISCIKTRIDDIFIQSQQYFLSNCLMEEINNIATLEEAETLKIKLRKLNSLGIKIADNKNANYEKYNFVFIRKYLQIINRSKSYEDEVKFDDVEKYLKGEDNALISLNNKLLEKISKLDESEDYDLFEDIGMAFVETFQEVVEKIKDSPGISKMANNIVKQAKKFIKIGKKDQFIAIDRGDEGKIYIKEIGEEVIADNQISVYEFLTEEQYQEYIAGNTNVKGELLRGNIDFKKLKKDEEYKYYVGHSLLKQERIENKLLNYNGYIGYIGEENRKHVNPVIQERLEEVEKYIKINPMGYEQDLYILEVENKDNDDVNRYLILTKDEVKDRREGHNSVPRLTIQGNIDLEKLEKDIRYREVVETSLLTKNRIEESCKNFKGYVGEIETNIFGNYKCSFIKHIEQFADKGANGEKKCSLGYFSVRGETGELDMFGNKIYEFELITPEEMQKMWNDSKYIDDPERERIIVIGSNSNLSMFNRLRLNELALCGGYIGGNMKLCEKYANNKMVFEELGVILWKMGDNTYLSPLGKDEFNNRNRIHGNLDVGRMNSDPEYRRFVIDKILTREYVLDILAQDINNIEINEKEGELSIGKISKKKKEKKPQFSRDIQGQDR